MNIVAAAPTFPVSSPPASDDHSPQTQPSSALSPAASSWHIRKDVDPDPQAPKMVPRALALNDAEVVSIDSEPSSRLDAAIALASPTPTSKRPTGRVVLQALEPRNEQSRVHLSSYGGGMGGGDSSGVYPSGSVDSNDSNKHKMSPSEVSTKAPASAPAPAPASSPSQGGGDGSSDLVSEAHKGRAIRETSLSNDDHDEEDDNDADGDDDGDYDQADPATTLAAPLALALSPVASANDAGFASADESTQPRGRTIGAGGRSIRVKSPPQDSSNLGKSITFGIKSIPSFLQRAGLRAGHQGAAGENVAQTNDKSSGRKNSRWSMLYSARSVKTGNYDDMSEDELVEHNGERARKNWRVLRAVFMALGIFRVGGLNRLRAKQLSAAEVKRGLRRNVTGGGQNIIPTMSFYAPKVTGDTVDSAAQYEALCSQWARFSPAIVHRMLRQKLLNLGSNEQEFTCERFSTTLLFADISGFTRLSARLNAEQLKTHTNQYFTMLIDVVARYGGDIIKFCGDAVMIVWPSEHTAPRGVLQANAMQGAACALTMLSECGEYDVGKGEEAVALRLHCGMGSGQMYGYLVGADDRWEYLVAGDPLRQIGEAEPEATQGEVILSPEAWELASTDFMATKTPQGNWLLKELKDVSRPSSPTREAAGERIRRQRVSAAESPRLPSSNPTPDGGATAAAAGGGGGDAAGGDGLAGASAGRASKRFRGGSPAQGNPGSGGGERTNNGVPAFPRPSEAVAGDLIAGGGGVGGGISAKGGGGTPVGGSSGRPRHSGKKNRKESNSLAVFRRDRAATHTEEDESTMSVAHPTNQSAKKASIASPSCGTPATPKTVTMNVNQSSAVSEEHRLQASDYLAPYIEAQYDGGVEKSMKRLSTALRGFTQESARHAIQSNTVKYLAEIRFVTTIFINIYGLEEQLKRGGGFLLQQTMDLGVSSLLKFGGVLRQFVVDDKGCVMIGAFGLPQYSYEDNEVRAISASKEIILAFEGLQLGASIGITTGQVYCGFVGASKRCEYAMMGCSVNLSARLMASAPKNTIQVDFEVWKRAHNFFDFETLTPIKAKGYVDPVPVFRPLEQALKDDNSKRVSDAGGTDSDLMIGVTAELEVLENSVRRLQNAGITRPVILLGQSGSGKTRLVRSAQLQRIWRDGTNIAPTSQLLTEQEETKENGLDGSGSSSRKSNGGRGGGVAAPAIITVCRNVHANTPYCIWNSILDKIFKLDTEVSSPETGGACARVSFTTKDDQQHLNESPASIVNASGATSEATAGAMGTAGAATTQGPPSAWAEKKQDHASVTSGAIDSRGSSFAKARQLSPPYVGTKNDAVLSPARSRTALGHLPPLSTSPPSLSPGTAALALGGKEGASAKVSLISRRTTLGPTIPYCGGDGDENATVVSKGSERSAGSAARSQGGSATRNETAKPRSLLKQRTESSIHQPGERGRGAPLLVTRHKDRWQEMMRVSSEITDTKFNEGKSLPTTRFSANESGREEAAERRPRYDKIKMRSPVANTGKGTGSEGQAATVKSPPRAFKLKMMAGGSFGTVSVAQRVVAGFRGDPDWASGASRIAKRRSASKRTGSDDDTSGPRTSSKRKANSKKGGAASLFSEKSRRDQASRRSVARRMSAFVQEHTVRRGDDEIDTKSKSSTHSAAVLPQMLTAENLKGIASVEMEMEGMESKGDPVKAEGEAAKIIEWMRRSCPDMVPIAPLLKELMFTGFSETRMTAAFPPDVRHRNLERLVVEVVRTVIDNEGKRLLLIIEDAQWMNQLSMKLLLKVARAGLRMMIIISARPFEEYFETVPHDFTTFREIGTTIEMSPLSPSDCLVLARHVIGEAVIDAHPEADLLPEGSDLVLHKKSGGGNPLFVRNIAITLRDNLVTSGAVTPLVDLPVGFFHALIVSRFDALEPPEQTVLKAGTVIGATFSKDLLLHMLPNNSRYRTENLHEALLKLIEANFISRSVVGRTEHFSFVHTSVQETVYTMMLTDQKESLHEVCAQWHEKHNKGNANYQSVIMHHWMRSSNTPKKVECHLVAANKAHEVSEHEVVIQHMLALLAIAFGKDMATATVISLEPFLEATQPLLNKQDTAASKLPPPPPRPAAAAGFVPKSDPAGSDRDTVEQRQKTDVTIHRKSSGQDNQAAHGKRAHRAAASLQTNRAGLTGHILNRRSPRILETEAVPRMRDDPQLAFRAPPQSPVKNQTSAHEQQRSMAAARTGESTGEGHASGLCGWFTDGLGATGLTHRRRRFSSMVVPVAAPLTGKEAEAAERLHAARTAARLGCSVGNLTKRQREMLVAKDQEWLWAADFLPWLEFSDPLFSPTLVARWIGAIGMAHLHLGRLLPAHNHMQEALVYLGFPAVPSQALPFDRAACLAKEFFLMQGPARDLDDTLFAAKLYGAIADISIKTGMGGNLSFINRLVKVSTRKVDFVDKTQEGIRLLLNLAHEELAKGHHDNTESLLDRALALSIDIGDPITRGIALIASGTYSAGEGLVTEAEEHFAEAFEMFAPAGDYSRCGEVVVGSAYAKLCSGDTPEALSMFNEVRDTAISHNDDYLSQASLHGAALVHAITGNMAEASAGLAKMRSIVEEDWARRRGRRGRTAAATEGTSHASLVVMETLGAYLAASRGNGKAALKGVCRASLRLSRPGALRFSSGLFLHLATDACFTILEQDMLPPGPDSYRKVIAAARLLIRTLGRFAQIFDLMSPLHQLGRARWSMLHGMDKVAEKALDLGLEISEEDVHFPFAEGLLLLHSTRIESLPMDERRARARRGRRTLHRIGACLIPPADRTRKKGEEKAEEEPSTESAT